MKQPQRSITEVLAEHSPRLMAISGVTAVGEGALSDGRPCIRVYLLRKDRALERSIPRTIEGYPVILQVSGEIRAMPDSH